MKFSSSSLKPPAEPKHTKEESAALFRHLHLDTGSRNQYRSFLAAMRAHFLLVVYFAIGSNWLSRGADSLTLVHPDGFALVDEVLKQRAVVDHRPSQIFTADLAPRLPNCDFMRCPIILRDDRVIGRDICRSLFEVAHRISARSHHVAEQLICFGNPRPLEHPQSAPAQPEEVLLSN